jgi:hypothetical protein
MGLSPNETRVLMMIEDEFRQHDPELQQRFDDFGGISRKNESPHGNWRPKRFTKLLGALLLVFLIALPRTAMLTGRPWVPLGLAYGRVTSIPVRTAAVLGRWAGEQVQLVDAGVCRAAGTACG